MSAARKESAICDCEKCQPRVRRRRRAACSPDASDSDEDCAPARSSRSESSESCGRNSRSCDRGSSRCECNAQRGGKSGCTVSGCATEPQACLRLAYESTAMAAAFTGTTMAPSGVTFTVPLPVPSGCLGTTLCVGAVDVPFVSLKSLSVTAVNSDLSSFAASSTVSVSLYSAASGQFILSLTTPALTTNSTVLRTNPQFVPPILLPFGTGALNIVAAANFTSPVGGSTAVSVAASFLCRTQRITNCT